MTTIPHFGASLLTNPPTATISEAEKNNLISTPQLTQTPDSFERDNQEQAPQKSGGFGFWTFLGASAALTGLIVGGRKGLLGKYVQKIMGGKPSEKILSEADISAKITEAITPLEEGGNKFGEVKFINNFATVERSNMLGDREIAAYAYKHKCCVERSNMLRDREIIAFDRKTGIPKRRIVFEYDLDGKLTGYKSYSEQDILASGLADTGTPAKNLTINRFEYDDGTISREFNITRNLADGAERTSIENTYRTTDKKIPKVYLRELSALFKPYRTTDKKIPIYTEIDRGGQTTRLYYDCIDGKVAGTHTLDELGNVTNQRWLDPSKRYLTDDEIYAKVEPKLSELGHGHIGFSAIKANGQKGYMERILPDGSRDIVTLDRVTGEPSTRIIVAPKGKYGERAYEMYDINDLSTPIKTVKDESYKKWFGLKGKWIKRTVNNNGSIKTSERKFIPQKVRHPETVIEI